MFIIQNFGRKEWCVLLSNTEVDVPNQRASLHNLHIPNKSWGEISTLPENPAVYAR